jgi:hypothetical protein
LDECEDPTLLTPAFLHLLPTPRHRRLEPAALFLPHEREFTVIVCSFALSERQRWSENDGRRGEWSEGGREGASESESESESVSVSVSVSARVTEEGGTEKERLRKSERGGGGGRKIRSVSSSDSPF